MADPLSIVASIIAILDLSYKVTQYLKDVKGGSQKRLQLCDELRNTATLLEMLKDRVEDVEYQGTWTPSIQSLASLNRPLDQFRKILESIVDKLLPKGKLGRAAQALMWLFDKDDIIITLHAIERQKSLFLLALQNDHIKLSQRIKSKVHEVSEQISRLEIHQTYQNKYLHDLEDRELLSWISPLNFRAKQNDTLDQREAGTGQWLFQTDTFKCWLNGTERTLWCSGIPGAGKTVFASVIIDFLEQEFAAPDIRIAFIYCRHKDRAEQTSTHLIANLLRQLVERSPGIPEDLRRSYRQYKQRKIRPKEQQYTELLSSLVASLTRVFIIIDALDECDQINGSRSRLVSAINSLPNSAQLLCTSRSLPDIEHLFESCRHIEIQASESDVHTYLSSRIMQGVRLSKHVGADPSLKNELVNTIIRKVKGMFLLAQLHIDALAQKQTRKALRVALNSLPKGLDETYNEALHRIRSQDDDDVTLAIRVLSCITFADRPLKVSEMQHAIAAMDLDFEEEYLDREGLPDVDILLTVYAGIMTVEKESTIIRLVHYTAEEYFGRRRDTLFPEGRISLAGAYIKYLSLQDFPDTCTDDTEMLLRLESYPLLHYSGLYWRNHARGEFEQNYIDQLSCFLRSTTALKVALQVQYIPKHRYSGWSQWYPRNVPAIVIAASFGLHHIVTTLLQSGITINATGTDGRTALIAASRGSHILVVSQLIKYGADVEAPDAGGETALTITAIHGHEIVFDQLLRAGDDMKKQAEDGWTPLMAAADNGHDDIVKKLIAAGTDVNVQSKNRESALSRAARGGFDTIIGQLLDVGAKLSAQTSEGRTALTIARNQGHQAIIRMLMANASILGLAQNVRPGLQRQVTEELLLTPEMVSNYHSRTPYPQNLEGATLERVSANVADRSLHNELVGTSAFRQQYILQQLLGTGHFAMVYQCRDKISGKLHSVKIFQQPTSVRPGEGIAKHKQEIEVLKKLSHPRLITLEDVINEDDKVYLIFELAAEGELFSYIVEKGKLSELESRRLLVQVAQGLQYVHEQKIVHCDIKPENILLMDKKLTVKISDFGIATTPGEDGFIRTLQGTPSYVAPEVLESSANRRYSYPVDIWSLGVVLYICLCGFPPFSDELYTQENPYSLTEQIKMGCFDYPSPYWDPIPDQALDLVDRMLTTDVAKRVTVNKCLGHIWTVGNEEIWKNPGMAEYGPEARGKPCRHEILLGEVFYRCRSRGLEEELIVCESCLFASDYTGPIWSKEIDWAGSLGRFCDCGDGSTFVGDVAVTCAIHRPEGGNNAVMT